MLKLRMSDQNTLDSYSDLAVGDVLRRARVEYGLELPYVAAYLNLRIEHLAAIEAGDIARLPGRVYAIGFVRAYANYLQLDSDKIVYMFKSQCIGHTVKRDLRFPVPVTESRNPAWWMVVASLGTLTLIGGLVWFFSGTAEQAEPKPELPAVVAAPASKPVAEALGKLKISAIEASWVEVRDANAPDKILFSQVLKAGESYTAPEAGNLLLSTGNAEGVSISWDGKTVDVFEGRKGIVRDLPVSGLTAYKVAPQ